MISIIKMDHSDELLSELSRIAFDISVFKQLGYPVFSDENHKWFLLYKHQKLIGFCAAVIGKKKIKFCHDYVIHSEREQGHYNALFAERLRSFDTHEVEAVCTHKSISTFIRYGFQTTKKTKNYTFVNKKI